MDRVSQRQIDVPWSVHILVRVSGIDAVSDSVVLVSPYPVKLSHKVIEVTSKIPVILWNARIGAARIIQYRRQGTQKVEAFVTFLRRWCWNGLYRSRILKCGIISMARAAWTAGGKPMTLMSLGLYQKPARSLLSSISY
jgi:hypothetical protein